MLPPPPQLPPTRRHIPKDREVSDALDKTAMMLEHTRYVRKVSDRIFLCEHLMDYNLARLHEPTLNLSAHA